MLYCHYNNFNPSDPDVKPHPNPQRLKAFIYASLDIESEES
ncbi:unnamed protein product, partial [marine sediment metagenome]